MPSSSTPRKPRPSRAKAKGPTQSKVTSVPVEPTNKPVSPASAWRKKVEGIDVELPSGNVAKVSRPGMPQLISEGVFSDSLLPIVQQSMNRAQNKAVAERNADNFSDELVKDPKKMADMMRAFDAILILAVQEPKVKRHEIKDTDSEGNEIWTQIPTSDREEDVLYTDWVDLDDKTFIFQYVVGGNRDLDSFREQSSAAVAALQDGEDVLSPSE